MTVNRRSSVSRSKKATSKTKARSGMGTAQPSNGAVPSKISKGARSKELSHTKRIQIYQDDVQRLDTVSDALGYEGQSPAEQLQELLDWIETQLQDATSTTNSKVGEPGSNDLAALMAQLMGTMTALTHQFQQQQQTNLQLTTTLSQMLQSLETNRMSRSSSTLSFSGKGSMKADADSLGFLNLSSPDLKKSHAKGSAEEKLKRAFQSIVDYNDNPKCAYANKWAINQNALAELTGCNRPAIKAFLKQYASEIEAHHQKHKLLARHNYAHGKVGVKITDVIHW